MRQGREPGEWDIYQPTLLPSHSFQEAAFPAQSPTGALMLRHHYPCQGVKVVDKAGQYPYLLEHMVGEV